MYSSRSLTARAIYNPQLIAMYRFMQSVRSAQVLVIIWMCLIGTTTAIAQNFGSSWPQWGGAERNFHVHADTLARTWPETGPPELWRRPLGEGYSAILEQNGILVTMYRNGDDEIIAALDADSGTTLWEYAYDAPLVHDGYFDVWLNAAGPGPYATPLIVNELVYAVGVNGHFHALDLQSGTLRWSQNLVERFTLVDYNAFASSPVAYRGNVILPMGGSSHGVVAFDQETGAIAWESESFPLGPGSPQLIAVNNYDQLVVWGQQELVGLDVRNGTRLWTHPHSNDLGLNVATPIWSDTQHLFVSSAYNGGSRMLQIEQDGNQASVNEVWSTPRTRLHFSNALRVENLILGSSGDFGPAFLTALHADTGEELWRDRSFARAHLLYADDVVVLVDEDGDVAVASVSDRGLNVHARKTLLTENSWTPPTLIGSTLYVRDRQEIVALDLGE